jgi:hypothetical protein
VVCSVWKPKKEGKDGVDTEVKKETLQKRVRRFVYRFMIDVEQKNPNFFPVYLACFLLWSKRDLLQDGSYKYAEKSMYPCESGKAPGDMTTWETLVVGEVTHQTQQPTQQPQKSP